MLFQVKEITAGKGANVIMESVGGEVFKECLRRLVIMMILWILAIICKSLNPCASLMKLTSNSNLPSFHLLIAALHGVELFFQLALCQVKYHRYNGLF